MTATMRLYFLVLLQILYVGINAQTTPLIVKLDDQNKPYITHVVGGKENFYSIGRTYNISPRVFAPYNGLELTSGLSIGQSIKIPLNETNFWQAGARKGNETVVPLYHQVQSRESLVSIGKLYNTDKQTLISWNNITGEKISTGENIIIGFLKVDKALSPLAAQGMGPRSEPPSPKVEVPVTSQKKETEKEKAITTTEPGKPVVDKPAKPVQKPIEQALSTYTGSGYFKEEYNEQTSNGKNIQKNNFKGGSFKSTSGWTDGKFYILIDGIEKGTIVQLQNPSDKKVIFAKVLAGISETKPGATESFLISNAAAAQLDLKGNSFELDISWEK
jgi:hypothetical protein